MATVSLWPSARLDHDEFMSGLVWAVGNACTDFPASAPNATPLTTTWVPQLTLTLSPPLPILSGIFHFTPNLLFISSPFCKQTTGGFVIERMSCMTPVTFPHPPTSCWWKTLCHAMTSNNFPMKEWFLPTSCCSEGGTGVTAGTAWLGRGSSCIALLSIWILWTFPQADAISGNHPVGRCLISPGDFPESTYSTVEKPVTKLPSSASVEQITRQEWTAELIT